MIARLTYLAMLAMAPAQAQQPGDTVWTTARAQAYVKICMGAAPDFANFDALAQAQGLTSRPQGWHLAPDSFLTLRAHEGFCNCVMTVPTPDPGAMAGAMFGALMESYAVSFKGPQGGLVNVAPFDRDGVEAVSIIEPFEQDGAPWLAARVAVFGACPVSESTQ